VLRPEPDGISITHHAIEFDARTAAERIRAQRLPAGYAAALETGLWLSLDVLPDQERATTGQALSLDCQTFYMTRRASIAAE